MRIATWVLLLHCACGVAAAEDNNNFQQPCSRHIQSSWSAELRKAAQVDCAFYDDAQKSGASAWAKYAEEDAAMKGLNGREEIRAKFQQVYQKPGFRLLWFPTGGNVFGNFVVTTGNYERHATGADGKDSVSHGRYVTVWHKQQDGSYLYVWDGGE